MADNEALADMLKRDVDQAVANGQDLTEPSARKTFLNDFVEKYPDRKFTADQVRPSLTRTLDKKLGKENIKKKLGSKKLKFNSKLASEISSKSSEKPSGITDTPKPPQGQTPAPKVGPDGKPLPQQDSTIPPVRFDHWTAKGIGALFQSFFLPLKAMWPEMPTLSDEDKISLGEMWIPAFQRYGDEKLQFLIFPAMGTMGILIPKIAEGRKKHKEAEGQKEKKKQDTKLIEQEEQRDNKLHCRYCNEPFDTAHLKQHEQNCSKKVG